MPQLESRLLRAQLTAGGRPVVGDSLWARLCDSQVLDEAGAVKVPLCAALKQQQQQE